MTSCSSEVVKDDLDQIVHSDTTSVSGTPRFVRLKLLTLSGVNLKIMVKYLFRTMAGAYNVSFTCS